MFRLKPLSCILTAVFFLAASSACAAPPAGSVLENAKAQEKDSSFSKAVQKGGVIEPTPDGISFTVWREPKKFDPKKGITLVSLHGHAGWATRGLLVWDKALQQRGYAFLAVQWWYGRSLESNGYAKPPQIYRWIEDALKKHGVAPGRVIFIGYSMGSANSYGVSLFDHEVTKNNYFGVNIADSGPMESDFPLYRRIFDGEFGAKPFQDTRWLLYCSLNDEELNNPCRQMEKTQEWLTGFGAKVDWFYQDSAGGHGGFMQGSLYNPALDLAEKILAEK